MTKAYKPIGGFGSAASENVKKGVTFTSDGGIKLVGTLNVISEYGNAVIENVATGKTFTSNNGINVAGTGLMAKVIIQAQYDALAVKDPNTYYLIF